FATLGRLLGPCRRRGARHHDGAGRLRQCAEDPLEEPAAVDVIHGRPAVLGWKGLIRTVDRAAYGFAGAPGFAFLGGSKVQVVSATSSSFLRVVRTCLTILPGTSSESHILNSTCSPSGSFTVPSIVLHLMSLSPTFTVPSPVFSFARIRARYDF